jgi:hypothetical protein
MAARSELRCARGRLRVRGRSQVLRAIAASCLLLLFAGCERHEVSLGDDAPEPAPPPAVVDAGDDPNDDRHDDPQPVLDAGGFHDDGDEPFRCGACDPGELCTRTDDPTCDVRDVPVGCARIEDLCPSRAAPVCGCDGQTYGSRCEAVALGVTVRTEGSCVPPESAVQCASFAGASCGQERYCRFALGAFCGNGGVLGTCEPRPERCDDFGATVCGCDGRSYENACWAAMAGVSVAFLGPCGSGGGRF